MKNRALLLNVVIWLCMSLGIMIIIGHLNIPRYWALNNRGIKIEGTVTNKDPQNHRMVYFTYNIGNKIYKGMHEGGAGSGNPDFNQLNIGDKIIVYYDPLSPECSVLGYPRNWLINELIAVILCAIIVPTFAIWRLNMGKIGVNLRKIINRE